MDPSEWTERRPLFVSPELGEVELTLSERVVRGQRAESAVSVYRVCGFLYIRSWRGFVYIDHSYHALIDTVYS